MSNSPASKTKMGKLDLFALAFGAMIGWSWVVLSGEWILTAGPLGAMIAFLIGGIMILFVGQVFAELVSAMPNGNGASDYCLRAYGRKTAFWSSWMKLLCCIAIVAFESVAFPTVIQYLFPNYVQGFMYQIAGFDIYATWVLVGTGSSLLIALINFLGARSTMTVQTTMVIVVIAIGLTLIGGSSVNGVTENMQPLFSDGVGGILAVTTMTPFMYVGFDVIPQVAAEINMQSRKIAKLLIFSVCAAIVWYIAIVFSVSRTMPVSALQTSTLATADAMQNAFNGHPLASKVLLIGGIAGIVCCWNAFYITGSRLILSLAESGMLPACFAKIHPRFGTPVNAILLIAVVTAPAPLLGRNMLSWLSTAGGFGFVICILLVSFAFLRLRSTEPEMPRPYRAGKSKIFGILSLLSCIFLILLYSIPGTSAALGIYEWAIIALWSGIGLILFRMSGQK